MCSLLLWYMCFFSSVQSQSIYGGLFLPLFFPAAAGQGQIRVLSDMKMCFGKSVFTAQFHLRLSWLRDTDETQVCFDQNSHSCFETTYSTGRVLFMCRMRNQTRVWVSDPSCDKRWGGVQSCLIEKYSREKCIAQTHTTFSFSFCQCHMSVFSWAVIVHP